MKKVVFTAIFLLVLGTAWTLYLEQGNKRFIEDLPKAPTAVRQTVNTMDAPTTSEDRETVSIDVVPLETTVEDTHSEHEHPLPHQHPHMARPKLTVKEKTDFSETWEALLDEIEVPQDPEVQDSLKSQGVTMEKYIRAKETFQQIYMNPENWLKGKPGEVGSILALTQADELALAEANYILNPTVENKKRLESAGRSPAHTLVPPPPNLEEDYKRIPLKKGYTLYTPR